ncbi:hypothetical protein [Marinomonas sp.]|uniref:hypothetical protein n=1 Tax=Marinomonas sp. TaxID=1904862 RepID=UPI003BA91CAD
MTLYLEPDTLLPSGRSRIKSLNYFLDDPQNKNHFKLSLRTLEKKVKIKLANFPLSIKDNINNDMLYIFYTTQATNQEINQLVEYSGEKNFEKIMGRSNQELLLRMHPFLEFNMELHLFYLSTKNFMNELSKSEIQFNEETKKFDNDTLIYIYGNFGEKIDTFKSNIKQLVKRFPYLRNIVDKSTLSQLDVYNATPILKRPEPAIMDVDGILRFVK